VCCYGVASLEQAAGRWGGDAIDNAAVRDAFLLGCPAELRADAESARGQGWHFSMLQPKHPAARALASAWGWPLFTTLLLCVKTRFN
jgi:hypothetical protein